MNDWMKTASTLPPGQSTRINCGGCGGKKTASVTNMGKKYVKHCFKCKETETETPPPMTAAERLEMKRKAEAFEAQEPRLPDDFTTDIPVEGLLWLSKGGLHLNDIRRYGFGFSEELRRVIMPVVGRSGKLEGVQARRVDADGVGPKYLGQVWSGPRPVWASSWEVERPRGIPEVVLTEDILSAARVGKVCPAWSLLGTNLMPAVIGKIAEAGIQTVHVWMDDDDAGINARRKMLRQLGAVGINAKGVISNRDPKHHTLEEIEELIWTT